MGEPKQPFKAILNMERYGFIIYEDSLTDQQGKTIRIRTPDCAHRRKRAAGTGGTAQHRRRTA